jgi:hypothetical protein
LSEKRAILASWASDACAVECRNAFRSGTTGSMVKWDEIMDALRSLDRQKSGIKPDSESGWSRWQRRRWRVDGAPLQS